MSCSEKHKHSYNPFVLPYNRNFKNYSEYNRIKLTFAVCQLTQEPTKSAKYAGKQYSKKGKQKRKEKRKKEQRTRVINIAYC